MVLFSIPLNKLPCLGSIPTVLKFSAVPVRSNNNCCCYCCNAFLPSFIPGMQSKSKNKNNIAAAAYIFFRTLILIFIHFFC